MSIITEIQNALKALSNREKAKGMSKFFKIGKGEYAENDIFIGVSVPHQRKITKTYWKNVRLQELSQLISSEIHEFRLTALLILIEKFEKSNSSKERKEIVNFYLNHLNFINNWDLVDTSCYKILGRYCFENQNIGIILDLSKSEEMWHKRIAVVGSLYFIKNLSFNLTKILIEQELNNPHDLMQKANGWMLREMGKIDEKELINFLKKHYKTMPRTTLRYAIERLENTLRQDFLKGKI